MNKNLIKSFGYAFKGIMYTLKTQRNFKIHLVAAIIVIGLASFFEVSKFEWLILLLTIGLVLFAELLNTSIEKIVDLVSPEYHILAKHAKDTAAASVLILAITAIVIACIVFIPYVF